MWSSSFGMEYRFKTSPYASGESRAGNPHFDKEGRPVSDKAKKINGVLKKASNSSKHLEKKDNTSEVTTGKDKKSCRIL